MVFFTTYYDIRIKVYSPSHPNILEKDTLNNDEYRRQVEKRLQTLEKIAKEMSEKIEQLKLLLKGSSSVPREEPEKIVKTEQDRIDDAINLTCLHYFGYLELRPKSDSIPSECLYCLKMVDCFKHSD